MVIKTNKMNIMPILIGTKRIENSKNTSLQNTTSKLIEVNKQLKEDPLPSSGIH